MQPVAGNLHKQHPIDRIHRAYQSKCKEFAQTYGYDANWIATWFEQFTFMRVREQGMHFNLASWCAMRDVQAFFYKVGGEFN